MFDFSNLTLNQQLLLTYQGWTVESASLMQQPSKRTVKKLIDRGLVIPRQRWWKGIAVTEYEVPIPVHMAWCEKCDDVSVPPKTARQDEQEDMTNG